MLQDLICSADHCLPASRTVEKSRAANCLITSSHARREIAGRHPTAVYVPARSFFVVPGVLRHV